MAADIRLTSEGDFDAFARSVSLTFLDTGNDDAESHWRAHLEVGRTWVADDRGRVVGTSCTFTRDITVPGLPGAPCPVVPFTAVSGVGVHPSHRRQGVLRRMMGAMLDDGRARGEAFAGLLASESAIYGRFGFGQATTVAEVAIDTRYRAFQPALEPPRLDVELLDAGEAGKVLPALHDQLRRERAGDVVRNDATWADTFGDHPNTRNGMSANMYAVTDGGFAVYRGKEGGRGQRGELRVRLLYGATPEITAGLWKFLLDVDLVDVVTAGPRPIDESLRWRLVEPRALRTTDVSDMIWLRPLNTPATLTARRYRSEGRLVLEVLPPGGGGADPAAGRWVLEAGPDGATCRAARPAEAADVVLGLADLGSLYLGGVAATTLAAAGRVVEGTPGGLAVADRLFATPLAPYSGTGF